MNEDPDSGDWVSVSCDMGYHERCSDKRCACGCHKAEK